MQGAVEETAVKGNRGAGALSVIAGECSCRDCKLSVDEVAECVK